MRPLRPRFSRVSLPAHFKLPDKRGVRIALAAAALGSAGMVTHCTIEQNIEQENRVHPMSEQQKSDMRSRQWTELLKVGAVVIDALVQAEQQSGSGYDNNAPYDGGTASGGATTGGTQPTGQPNTEPYGPPAPAPKAEPQAEPAKPKTGTRMGNETFGPPAPPQAEPAPKAEPAPPAAPRTDRWKKYRCINDPRACEEKPAAPKAPQPRNDNGSIPDAQNPDISRKYRDVFGPAPQR